MLQLCVDRALQFACAFLQAVFLWHMKKCLHECAESALEIGALRPAVEIEKCYLTHWYL